jgi:hypothetical protein
MPTRTVSFAFVVLCDVHGNSYDNGNGEFILDNTMAIHVLKDNIMDVGVDMLIGLDLLEEWQSILCLLQWALTVCGAM